MKLDNSWINDNSYKIIRSILCYRAGSIFKKVHNLKIKSLISLIFLENLQSINYKQQTVTPFQSAEKWPQGDFALKLYLTIYKYTYLSYSVISPLKAGTVDYSFLFCISHSLRALHISGMCSPNIYYIAFC